EEIVSFVTKDSGERAEFASGMVRDTDKGKARFDLLIAEGVPYKHQFLTRCAELMMRGAEKYNDRNWEKANSTEEVARMKSSAFRHFMQWFCGETDEAHAAAVIFNILAAETTEWKIKNESDAVQSGQRGPRPGPRRRRALGGAGSLGRRHLRPVPPGGR